MSNFRWMEESLRLMTLDELRDCGVTVYQAPKVPKRARVVNLMNGVLIDFSIEREVPADGSYAKLDELRSLGSRFGVALIEENRILRPARDPAVEGVE